MDYTKQLIQEHWDNCDRPFNSTDLPKKLKAIFIDGYQIAEPTFLGFDGDNVLFESNGEEYSIDMTECNVRMVESKEEGSKTITVQTTATIQSNIENSSNDLGVLSDDELEDLTSEEPEAKVKELVGANLQAEEKTDEERAESVACEVVSSSVDKDQVKEEVPEHTLPKAPELKEAKQDVESIAAKILKKDGVEIIQWGVIGSIYGDDNFIFSVPFKGKKYQLVVTGDDLAEEFAYNAWAKENPDLVGEEDGFEYEWDADTFTDKEKAEIITNYVLGNDWDFESGDFEVLEESDKKIDENKALDAKKIAEEIMILVNKYQFSKDDNFKQKALSKVEKLKNLETDVVAPWGPFKKGHLPLSKESTIGFLMKRLNKKIKENDMSDEGIEKQYDDFKITYFKLSDSGNSGSIEIEFPNADGEDFETSVFDNWIMYDDGRIVFDNWFPEKTYSKLVSFIKSKMSNKSDKLNEEIEIEPLVTVDTQPEETEVTLDKIIDDIKALLEPFDIEPKPVEAEIEIKAPESELEDEEVKENPELVEESKKKEINEDTSPEQQVEWEFEDFIKDNSFFSKDDIDECLKKFKEYVQKEYDSEQDKAFVDVALDFNSDKALGVVNKLYNKDKEDALINVEHGKELYNQAKSSIDSTLESLKKVKEEYEKWGIDTKEIDSEIATFSEIVG